MGVELVHVCDAVHPMGNVHPTIAPLAGVVVLTVHGVLGGGVTTTDPVIQFTVAVAEPVVPCVFWNVNVNDEFPVNIYVLLPLLLVIVTPVVENTTVAVTFPVVLVVGLYTMFPVRAITSVGSSHASSTGTHSLSPLSSCHAGIVSWIPSIFEHKSVAVVSGTQLLFSSSSSNHASQTQSSFSSSS